MTEKQSTIRLEDWKAEAVRRFGKNTKDWAFQCPICKRKQSIEWFEQEGIDIQLAYQECIGRHIDVEPACNYVAYGFIHSGIEVETPEGGRTYVFPFWSEEAARDLIENVNKQNGDTA